MKCEVKRSMLNKDLVKVVEFMVEKTSPLDLIPEPKPVTFTITPESLQNLKIVSIEFNI